MILTAALVLATVGAYAWRWAAPRRTSIVGVITALSIETRSGVLQVVHPKTGEVIELRGEIAPDCEIVIDGKPARTTDLALGDRVRADGLLYRYGKLTATRLTKLPAADQTSPSATEP